MPVRSFERTSCDRPGISSRRPTLRWLLELTKSRVHRASAYQYRELEIDAEVARRSGAVFARLLAGGQARTRDELGLALTDAGIPAIGLRLTYLAERRTLVEAIERFATFLGRPVETTGLD